MAITPSTMLPLGTIAPEFTLLDTVTGIQRTLSDLRSDVGTVVIFMCNHCPFVVHIIDCLVSLEREYSERGIQFIAINSNDVTAYPDDSPEKMTLFAKTHGFSFPYLYDETQAVAKAYQAACTPDFYVFDPVLACVYRGQFDQSRPGNDQPVTGDDLRDALDALIAGQTIPEARQQPSQGCNIKWKD